MIASPSGFGRLSYSKEAAGREGADTGKDDKRRAGSADPAAVQGSDSGRAESEAPGEAGEKTKA